jgi:hypothetical protein
LETFKTRSDLIQTNLVSELQSLPVINKRLESDCAFMRDDLRNCAQKITHLSKENQQLEKKLILIDSILSTEQRVRLGAAAGPHPIATAGQAAAENKRLQIETMELRMRLVDSQAARDKAQTQLIDQSQMIARLQKELGSAASRMATPRRDLSSENVKPLNEEPVDVKRPRVLAARPSRLSTCVEQECRQQ